MMEELKPCPFCGYRTIHRSDEINTGYSHHTCGQCWARGPRVKGYDLALELWNRRENAEWAAREGE